jgi:hypothetical protein
MNEDFNNHCNRKPPGIPLNRPKTTKLPSIFDPFSDAGTIKTIINPKKRNMSIISNVLSIIFYDFP